MEIRATVRLPSTSTLSGEPLPVTIQRGPRRATCVTVARLTTSAPARTGSSRRRSTSFRHIEFLRLSERRILLIIVTPDGDVQNRILHTDRQYTPSQLIEASNFFNDHYAGQPFAAIRGLLADELFDRIDAAVGAHDHQAERGFELAQRRFDLAEVAAERLRAQMAAKR